MATKTICSTGGSNTGLIPCEYVPGIIGATILIPKGKTFSPSEQLAISATLKALAKNPNKSKRCYMLGRYTAMADKGTEQVTTTSNYGVINFVRDGKQGGEYTVDSVGLCTWKSFRGFHKASKKYDALSVDVTNNVILGTQKDSGYIGGLSLDSLFVMKPEQNDGSKPFAVKIEMQYTDLIELENFQIIEMPAAVKAIDIAAGLRDVIVEVVTPMTNAGVIVVKLTAGCGATNEGDVQGADLGVIGAWQVIQDSNGVSFPITAASYNSFTKLYTVTCTLPLVAAFPLATTANVNLVDNAALEALGTPVLGIEGIGATVTRI
jgi:hypothetical protein